MKNGAAKKLISSQQKQILIHHYYNVNLVFWFFCVLEVFFSKFSIYGCFLNFYGVYIFYGVSTWNLNCMSDIFLVKGPVGE
jgi:hypothetical protein